MLKFIPIIALLTAQAGFGFGLYHLGYQKAKNKQLETHQATLIKFAENQNNIYNAYTPQLEALNAEIDNTFASPLVSRAIDGLPSPKRKPSL